MTNFLAMQHGPAATIYLSHYKRKFWLEIFLRLFNIVQCVLAALPRQRLRPDGRFLPELRAALEAALFSGRGVAAYLRFIGGPSPQW
jgi:hypothetical protein